MITLRLWLHREERDAWLVSPGGVGPGEWLPKSQIVVPEDAGALLRSGPVTVELPDWLADQKRLRAGAEAYGAPLTLVGLGGPALLKRYVALRHGVPVAALLDGSRKRRLVAARRHLMALLYEHCGMSKSAIGRLLACDRKTVTYGLRRHGGAPWPAAKGTRPGLALIGPPGPTLLGGYVALRHGVSIGALLGRGQERAVARARQHLMTLLYSHCGMSTLEVGEYLRRDHSTVIHGMRRQAGRSRGEARSGGAARP